MVVTLFHARCAGCSPLCCGRSEPRRRPANAPNTREYLRASCRSSQQQPVWIHRDMEDAMQLTWLILALALAWLGAPAGAQADLDTFWADLQLRLSPFKK